MKSKNTAAPAIADPAPIPNPPGGGSWTWDEVKLVWVSNDPVPESAEQPAEQPQE